MHYRSTLHERTPQERPKNSSARLALLCIKPKLRSGLTSPPQIDWKKRGLIMETKLYPGGPIKHTPEVRILSVLLQGLLTRIPHRVSESTWQSLSKRLKQIKSTCSTSMHPIGKSESLSIHLQSF